MFLSALIVCALAVVATPVASADHNEPCYERTDWTPVGPFGVGVSNDGHACVGVGYALLPPMMCPQGQQYGPYEGDFFCTGWVWLN